MYELRRVNTAGFPDNKIMAFGGASGSEEMNSCEITRVCESADRMRRWAADIPLREFVSLSVAGRRVSPTGFEWGFGGSGPFAAAHSILTDWLGEEADHVAAERFKRDVIAVMPRGGGDVPEVVVAAYALSGVSDQARAARGELVAGSVTLRMPVNRRGGEINGELEPYEPVWREGDLVDRDQRRVRG